MGRVFGQRVVNTILFVITDVLANHTAKVFFVDRDFASAHQGPIHLLLTDIMPKLNGLVLAERLAQQRPETAVLFMSGYIEGGLVSANDPDAVLLQKPFTQDRLIETVRAGSKSKAVFTSSSAGTRLWSRNGSSGREAAATRRRKRRFSQRPFAGSSSLPIPDRAWTRLLRSGRSLSQPTRRFEGSTRHTRPLAAYPGR
jgi:CheY-like chemotaxis protein